MKHPCIARIKASNSRQLLIKMRLPLALPFAFACLSGCQQSAPLVPSAVASEVRTQSRTTLPPVPAGMVRLSGQKIQEDGKTFHWKWSILGDCTWHGFQGDTYSVELYNSSPLNAANQAEGANAYEYEVTLSASDSKQGGIDLHDSSSLHSVNGNGGSITGGGDLKRNLKRMPASQFAKALMTGEKTLPLPLNLPVLEVTEQEADGKKYHRVFRIKIAK